MDTNWQTVPKLWCGNREGTITMASISAGTRSILEMSMFTGPDIWGQARRKQFWIGGAKT